jgi:hypothetical protein
MTIFTCIPTSVQIQLAVIAISSHLISYAAILPFCILGYGSHFQATAANKPQGITLYIGNG